MEGKNLRLKVLTPSHTVLDFNADFILLRTVEGDMGVLYGHEPGAVMLDYGVLQAFLDKKPVHALALPGGFATVTKNCVTVLTSFAGPPDRIEEIMAERERERAESRLLEQRSDLEARRIEAALRHALVKMDISSYPIMRNNEETTE